MNKETWKVVGGYEGLYEVSDLGRIRSLGRECNSKNGSKQRKKERILIQEVTIHGYCRVRLFDAEGKAKHYPVHRLVMNAFRGESDLQINHINEIKTDNRLKNLEYCTPKQNCNHGTRNEKIGGYRNSIPVEQISLDGSVIRSFDSITEAASYIGLSRFSIKLCCDGKIKTAGGYKWAETSVV